MSWNARLRAPSLAAGGARGAPQHRVYGHTEVVTGKSNAKGTLGGRELKGPVVFTCVYVKKKGKWQSVAFQQTPHRRSLN
jgi:hypothetical protein